MITKISLLRVEYMPKELESGILYVAEKFDAAAHLCACGCGSKVNTPLGPTEWSFKETSKGPSLYPSVGNWQLKCQSHYWICDGGIKWSNKWTSEQIAAGRRREDMCREKYFSSLGDIPARDSGLWIWLKSLFKS